MFCSPQLLRALLIAIALATTMGTGVFALGVYKVRMELRYGVDEKCLSLTAGALRQFVKQHGRWPVSEEEYLDYLGVPSEEREFERTHGELSRLIIEYDCDLAHENLDSPEEFRCLRSRDPAAMRESGKWYVEYLLEGLREVRDGRWAPPAPRVPAGQAVPDDAEETSGGEEGGSREGGVSESDAVPQ